MTALEELQSFSQVLAPLCATHALTLVCLKAEHLFPTPDEPVLSAQLYLSLLAEELICGHVVPLADGTNACLRVAAPLAATPTLKFIARRSFSLILRAGPGRSIFWWVRDFVNMGGPTDPWDVLTQAMNALAKAAVVERLFFQVEQLAPLLPPPNPQTNFIAYRAAFATGTLVGSVVPAVASGAEGAPATPANLYLL
jgi:hypothetical protein